jgi:formylglycine-generating enzyme
MLTASGSRTFKARHPKHAPSGQGESILSSQPLSTQPRGDRLVETPIRADMVWISGGALPCENLATDGDMRTSPAGVLPPAGHSLFNTFGNMRERAADCYAARNTAVAPKACCIPEGPRGGPEVDSYDWCNPRGCIPRKAVRRGSPPCAPNHRRRFHPAARHVRPVGTSRVGCRCVVRP